MSLIKTCSRALRTSDLGECSPSNRTMSLNVLEWPSQSPDLNPIKHLWRDLKITVQQLSPFNLTELERICREEGEKLPNYRCVKLVALFPIRLEAVIAAKGTSTKLGG